MVVVDDVVVAATAAVLVNVALPLRALLEDEDDLGCEAVAVVKAPGVALRQEGGPGLEAADDVGTGEDSVQ